MSQAIRPTRVVVESEGHRLHAKKTLRIARRHGRQLVTDLVVNEGVRPPREIRRRARAVEQHLAHGPEITTAPDRLERWRASRSMVEQRGAASDADA